MGSSRTRARTRVPCIGRRILNHCATREAPTHSFFTPLKVVLENQPSKGGRLRTAGWEPVLQASSFCGPWCSALPVLELNTLLGPNRPTIYWLNKWRCISEVIAFSAQALWCLHAQNLSTKLNRRTSQRHSLSQQGCQARKRDLQIWNYRKIGQLKKLSKYANQQKQKFFKKQDSCFLSSPEGEKHRLSIFQSAKFIGFLRRWSIYLIKDCTENGGFGSSFQYSSQLTHRTWDPRIIILTSSNI